MFLAERKRKSGQKTDDAISFVQKILEENSITFSADYQWRNWTFRYYADTARLYLQELSHTWPPIGSYLKGGGDSQYQWIRLKRGFVVALDCLDADLRRPPPSR